MIRLRMPGYASQSSHQLLHVGADAHLSLDLQDSSTKEEIGLVSSSTCQIRPLLRAIIFILVHKVTWAKLVGNLAVLFLYFVVLELVYSSG